VVEVPEYVDWVKLALVTGERKQPRRSAYDDPLSMEHDMRRHISLMELLNGRFDCRLSMRVPSAAAWSCCCWYLRMPKIRKPFEPEKPLDPKIQKPFGPKDRKPFADLAGEVRYPLLKSNNTTVITIYIINTYYLPPSSAHSSMSGETPTHKQQTKAQRPTMKMKQNHHAHAHGMNMNTPCPP
jgi:hypothetical protein